MGLITGMFGVVNGQQAVRNWQINHTSAPKKYVDSSTKGAPGRKRGIQDWTGSFSCYGKKPLVLPKEVFTMRGYCGPETGVEGDDGDVYGGEAIVDSVAISWNFETGDLIGHVVNFGGRVPLERTADVYEDNSTPAQQECIGLGIEVDGETVRRVTTITLTLTAENKTYVDSSTAGWTGRLPGNIDATLAFGVHGTNPDDFILSVGGDLDVKLYVDDTDFWRLRWMHFKDVSGINVDVEGSGVVGFSANFEFNGWVEEEQGCIILPGEVEPWWGVAPV